MATAEDCASVLEQFIHDAGNLPQEINHHFEELSAKDVEMLKSLQLINNRDNALQKHIKHHGTQTRHPKEQEFAESINQHYQTAIELQGQKIALTEKASTLLERQLKRLDVQIKTLQNDGQLVETGIPSVFNRKPVPDKALDGAPMTGSSPLQPASHNLLNMNAAAHRINSAISSTSSPSAPRPASQIAAIQGSSARSSAPATPAPSIPQNRAQRELSAGASDAKRRKLNNSSLSLNIPSQLSSLRQSSLGPSVTAVGTPKAGTPTASSGRADSVPRNAGSQAGTASAAGSVAGKKSSLLKKMANAPPHQQISKLKGKLNTKHARLSASTLGSGRKKGASPSVRSRGTGAGSDDENSVLSSADVSDAETAGSTSRHGSAQPSQQTPGLPAPHRGRRSKKELEAIAAAQQAQRPAPSSDAEEDGDGDDDDDEARYCFCQERSYGEMVACENEKCPYEWFHLECVHMKKAPNEDEIWYCPACRGKFNWEPKTKEEKDVVIPAPMVIKEEKKRGK